MGALTDQDVEGFLHCLLRLYRLTDLVGYPQRAMEALRTLFPAETISYNEINPARSRIWSVLDPEPDAFPERDQVFEHHMGDHPLIQHYHRTRDGRALTISDFLSDRRFRTTGLYAEFFRRLGLSRQIATTLPSSPRYVVGVGLSRDGPDFSDRDRIVLNLLRPHLVQAYENAAAFTSIMARLPQRQRQWMESRVESRLTEREGEILGLVAQGLTNKQIARALGVATRTVSKHLEHVYHKLGVGTRTAAAGVAPWSFPSGGIPSVLGLTTHHPVNPG